MPLWTTNPPTLSPDDLPWRGHWRNQEKVVPQVIAQAAQLIAPRGVYDFAHVSELTAEGPRLENGALLHSPRLNEALGNARRLLLAVCTIGPDLEATTRAWSKEGQIMQSFVLDALGVAALRHVSEKLYDELSAQFAPALLGCRHSPGDKDWPLDDQAVLFAYLQPAQIGVQLTAEYLMVPLKSVSYAIPLGRADELGPRQIACSDCERREICPYREG